MSILEALNARTMEMRKARDPMAATFQQIQAGAQAAAKSRALDATVTEEDAIAALKKAEKNAKDMITALDERIGEVVFNENHPLFTPRSKAQDELSAIQSLLPAKADVMAVREAAEAFLEGKERNMKAMGATMAHLRSTFGDSLDNAEASAVLRTILS